MKYWYLDATKPDFDEALETADAYWTGAGLLSVNENAAGTRAIVKVSDDTPDHDGAAFIAVYAEPPLDLVATGWYPE